MIYLHSCSLALQSEAATTAASVLFIDNTCVHGTVGSELRTERATTGARRLHVMVLRI